MAVSLRPSLVGLCGVGALAMTWLPATAAEVMTKQNFALSLDQAALTVCELRKQKMDYKLALNTGATPVFQLVKFRYGKRIEGVNGIPADQGLLRYLGLKISETSLKYCPKQLPSSVAKEVSAIKDLLK